MPDPAAPRGASPWRFELPILPQPSARCAEGTATILVADDSEAIRRLLIRSLEQTGYVVLSAANGPEALRVAAKHTGRLDLLVTDLIMSGMDGMELASRLRGERPGLPVLYISGHDDIQLPPGLCPASFLPKPFTLPDLHVAIRHVIG